MLSCPKNNPIRLKGKKYQELRRKRWKLDNCICVDCGRWIPLYDQDGVFDPFTCAHFAHIKSRGSGGSDTLENGETKCYDCHINKEHGLSFG